MMKCANNINIIIILLSFYYCVTKARYICLNQCIQFVDATSSNYGKVHCLPIILLHVYMLKDLSFLRKLNVDTTLLITAFVLFFQFSLLSM